MKLFHFQNEAYHFPYGKEISLKMKETYHFPYGKGDIISI